MLYQPERHESLIAYEWDESTVLEVIRDIVRATRKVGDSSNGLWPIHPKDEFEGAPRLPTDFYMGAAGVVWALRELKEFDDSPTPFAAETAIDRVLEAHSKHSASDEHLEPGAYFVGEAGIRLVKLVVGPTKENQSALIDLIKNHHTSKARELLYGSPGSLLIAKFAYERTGHSVYLDLIQSLFESILASRELDAASEALIWVQEFGTNRKYIGVAHGALGNYNILLKALRHCPKVIDRSHLIQQVERLLVRYSRVVNNMSNWPLTFSEDAGADKMLVQWCHGATGIITDLAGEIAPSESHVFDDLITKGANLVWSAGPLQKGPSLCHGTSGSALAFLKLYKRTNEIHWLKKARSFAMHAIAQYRAELKQVGHPRFSLWTGDLGLAIFLRDLFRQKAAVPGIDWI